jgi:hypothetical protein
MSGIMQLHELNENIDKELTSFIADCSRHQTVKVKIIADALNYCFMLPLSVHWRYVRDFPASIKQARLARECYADIFGSDDLIKLTVSLSKDPEGYSSRIRRYEIEMGVKRHVVSFEPETLGFEGLMEIPIKAAEKVMAKKAILNIRDVPERDIRVHDGAAGNMRIALVMERFLRELYVNSRYRFHVDATDVVESKTKPEMFGNVVRFRLQDMNQMDANLEDYYSVTTSFGAYYVNPVYLRPLQTLEAIRILEEGGIYCIGTPNESYDMRIIPRIFLAIDPRLDPTIPKEQKTDESDGLRRMLSAARFGATAWNLQRDVESRPDVSVVDTKKLKETLGSLGVESLFYGTWGEGVNNCYLGMMVRVTKETKDRINHYAEFRRKGGVFF